MRLVNMGSFSPMLWLPGTVSLTPFQLGILVKVLDQRGKGLKKQWFWKAISLFHWISFIIMLKMVNNGLGKKIGRFGNVPSYVKYLTKSKFSNLKKRWLIGVEDNHNSGKVANLEHFFSPPPYLVRRIDGCEGGCTASFISLNCVTPALDMNKTRFKKKLKVAMKL